MYALMSPAFSKTCLGMIQAAFQSHNDSIYVSWLPLFHDMGLIGCMLHAYWLGATCYFMAPTSFGGAL